MALTQDQKEITFNKILNPYFQTQIASVREILHSSGIEMEKDVVLDVVGHVGFLPLAKNPLKQKTLVCIARDFIKSGYEEIGRGILDSMICDANLSPEIKDLVNSAKA